MVRAPPWSTRTVTLFPYTRRCRSVGQPVDDGHARVRGEAFDACLLEGADHDQIDHAGNDARGVLYGFGAAQLRVAGGKMSDRSAQLIHTRLDRNASARAGLFKDHGQGSDRKRVVEGKGRSGRVV